MYTCKYIAVQTMPTWSNQLLQLYTSNFNPLCSTPRTAFGKPKIQLDRAQIYNFKRLAIRLHFPLQELRMWTDSSYQTLHQNQASDRGLPTPRTACRLQELRLWTEWIEQLFTKAGLGSRTFHLRTVSSSSTTGLSICSISHRHLINSLNNTYVIN